MAMNGMTPANTSSIRSGIGGVIRETSASLMAMKPSQIGSNPAPGQDREHHRQRDHHDRDRVDQHSEHRIDHREREQVGVLAEFESGQRVGDVGDDPGVGQVAGEDDAADLAVDHVGNRHRRAAPHQPPRVGGEVDQQLQDQQPGSGNQDDAGGRNGLSARRSGPRGW